MKVTEIFLSIDGEGKRTGLPTIFIRLHGCNLRCSYCDTAYSYDNEKYDNMSVEEIVQVCNRYGTNSVTLTGGEPLIHDGVLELIGRLLREGYWVNVETNGTVDVDKIRSAVDGGRECGISQLFFTIDYKCPFSKMEDKMDKSVFGKLRREDVLKFVVADEKDMVRAMEVLDNVHTSAEVYFSPVFGNIHPAAIVKFILEHKLWKVKVQMQLHKIIWDANKRGV